MFVIEPPAPKAAMVEVKLQRAQTFFQGLGAEDVEYLKRDPQIAAHLKLLARELHVLASAVGDEPKSVEEEERQVA